MKIRKDFLPFSRPSIGETEINAVAACLKSGWITTGALCKAFEEQLCALTGAPRAVSLSSATAGMHLMLTALNVGPGDEVITPSMTFASTVNLIALRQAKPVFVDVDYGTLNMDCEAMEEKITERTKVMIPVHFAGAPADMDRVNRLARKYSLKVIEDAAHAVGTSYKGTHAGGFGHPAIFSFHPIKNITTGEGGMITLNSAAVEKKLRLTRFHGIERDAWKRYGKGGNPSYDIAEPGYKYNMPDLLAALGLAQMERWRELNARRRVLAGLYFDGLRGTEGLDLPEVPSYDHVHAWHLFVVKVTGMSRDLFMQKLADHNIGYGLHFPPAHKLSYVKKRFGVRAASLPQTNLAADRIISLPLFPDMTENDVHYVCGAIKEILKNA
ncbi:MAG TPA: aminotransferase class I/II-fold pyridoxal phosphate-dependent enzyme [Smithellaceae bacterium]|jgi:dTDP-4-amino-4,6-dideoxygalactose transaminase|nr:aminotransferase class I/II-fold pyridoxal phosphate-dependent enzyme [Syntrophaceae bacterium]OQC73784.1 MAG: UDP-4-amino-4-deoxy-L-arabinose--oxoglutarate aminotransferase [Deltaproteobacteria bacterium ADurb.Bin002]HNV56302.1 aminotransferase class I/II-fold pyridoxal phosphate-dependent enzyme [Smithellaceae bacterium]MBP8664913.1 aminotransferase class I/II-fold pyridoxal phosphate-dependent enzyme [Syntrophaceae bacterium]HNY95931.1 aminotransferase class I/II-fold pyridoxal phosphate-